MTSRVTRSGGNDDGLGARPRASPRDGPLAASSSFCGNLARLPQLLCQPRVEAAAQCGYNICRSGTGATTHMVTPAPQRSCTGSASPCLFSIACAGLRSGGSLSRQRKASADNLCLEEGSGENGSGVAAPLSAAAARQRNHRSVVHRMRHITRRSDVRHKQIPPQKSCVDG